MSGARKVQKHAKNKKRSPDADTVWTVQLQINGKSEEDCITP